MLQLSGVLAQRWGKCRPSSLLRLTSRPFSSHVPQRKYFCGWICVSELCTSRIKRDAMQCTNWKVYISANYSYSTPATWAPSPPPSSCKPNRQINNKRTKPRHKNYHTLNCSISRCCCCCSVATGKSQNGKHNLLFIHMCMLSCKSS